MTKATNPVQRHSGVYKGCDVLVEEENGFFYYSVLNEKGEEILGGFRDAGSQQTIDFFRYLLKLVDDYKKYPESFEPNV